MARGLDDAHVLAPQLTRVAAAAAMRDHVDLLVHAERVIRDALKFFIDHQAALQPRVVRRDPRWAGVLVAAQRLDATERKHEPARGVDEIRADAKRPRRPRRGDEPARRNDAHAAAQPRLYQRVDHARRFWHSLFGCAFFGAFTVKVLAVRSRRMPGWTLPVVGGLLFSLLVGLWLTSALWFFDNSGFPSF